MSPHSRPRTKNVCGRSYATWQPNLYVRWDFLPVDNALARRLSPSTRVIHDGGGSLHSRLHQPRLQRLMHRFRLGPHSVFAVFALWRLFQAVAMRQKLRFSLGCSSSSKRFFCLEKFIALVTTPLTRQRGLKSRLAALYGRQDSDPV